MGLKRHAIAQTLIEEAGGDFNADRIVLHHRVRDLCDRFGGTYSTMRSHLCRLEDDGILLGRIPLVLSPAALASRSPDSPQAAPINRPKLRLVSTEEAGVEQVVAPPIQMSASAEVLWQLGAQAIDQRDLDSLQTIVDALVKLATLAPDRDSIATPDREIRDSPRNRDPQIAASIGEKDELNEVNDSVHSDSVAMGATASSRTGDRDVSLVEEAADFDPPPSGCSRVDRAVRAEWERHTWNPDADATPAWLRPGPAPNPTSWSEADLDEIRAHYRARSGEQLAGSLSDVLRLWSPDQVRTAIDAIASDPKINSPGGRLRVAATLGYHQYFPLEATAEPLPYWDVWLQDRENPPKTLDEVHERLESLSSIAHAEVYPVRVAAAVADHLDDVEAILDGNLGRIDLTSTRSVVRLYDGSTC